MSEEIAYRGRTIEIVRDDYAVDPRKEYDHLGTMVCWVRQYNLGDEQPRKPPLEYFADLIGADIVGGYVGCSESETFQKVMARVARSYIILPLSLYDHSGITMSCSPFPCAWDSGQAGWIYMPKKTALENWSGGRAGAYEMARKCLRSEVEEYDHYLTGNVYGWAAGDDSCFGYYGYDHEESGLMDAARDSIDCDIKYECKRFFKRKKVEIKNRIPLNLRTAFTIVQ